MRLFYEEWKGYVNRQPIADDLEVNEESFLLAIRQPLAGEINWNEFISLDFTHHMEILFKTTEIKERIFYIHECATRAWDKYTLREYIKSGLYQKRENLPNNFLNTRSPLLQYFFSQFFKIVNCQTVIGNISAIK